MRTALSDLLCEAHELSATAVARFDQISAHTESTVRADRPRRRSRHANSVASSWTNTAKSSQSSKRARADVEGNHCIAVR